MYMRTHISKQQVDKYNNKDEHFDDEVMAALHSELCITPVASADGMAATTPYRRCCMWLFKSCGFCSGSNITFKRCWSRQCWWFISSCWIRDTASDASACGSAAASYDTGGDATA